MLKAEGNQIALHSSVILKVFCKTVKNGGITAICARDLRLKTQHAPFMKAHELNEPDPVELVDIVRMTQHHTSIG